MTIDTTRLNLKCIMLSEKNSDSKDYTESESIFMPFWKRQNQKDAEQIIGCPGSGEPDYKEAR